MPRWKFAFLLLLPASLLTVYLIKVTYFQDRFEPIVADANQNLGVSRKEMAMTLASLKTELFSAKTRGLPPSDHAMGVINSMLHKLDVVFSVNHLHSEPDICPEAYTDSRYGYPFFTHGWVSTNCGKKPDIGNLITILLNPIPTEHGDCSNLITRVLSGIKEHYPTVPLILADRYAECRVKENSISENVTVVEFSSSTSDGKVWNSLISQVKTKYVCLAREVDHFTWFSRLERQISAFNVNEYVKIVGGSTRNVTGHWQMGCYQAELKNYILEYKDGYYASKNECAVCDHLLGPFVTLTNFTKEIQFDKGLGREVLFEDFFLRSRATGAFILNCPDAMYFSTDSVHLKSIVTRETWIPLARKWQLNRILFPQQHIRHAYTCKETEISCVVAMEIPATKFYLLPICCIEQYASAWKFMQEFAESHNFVFEIDTGSALGAVKMSGIIPWDIDGDLAYASANHTVIANGKPLFRKHGFNLRLGESPKLKPLDDVGLDGGYAVIDTPDGTIEMWGQTSLASFALPAELRNIPTRVNVNGAWIFAPPSPALFSRNRYGIEYLRHAQSYSHTGGTSSFAPYIAGHFNPCPKSHHACLDRFYPDGNLQFAIP